MTDTHTYFHCGKCGEATTWSRVKPCACMRKWCGGAEEGGMLDGRATDCKSAGETQAGSTPAPLTTQLEKSVTLHLRRHLHEQVFGKFADAFFGIAEKRKQRREKMKERLKVWGLLAALLLLGLTLWHGHALLARALGILPAHVTTGAVQ